jgi:enediyne biosynthesis protein E4
MEMRKKNYFTLIICFASGILFQCHQNLPAETKTLFESIDSKYSKIDFENSLPTTDSLTIFTFEYIYNGGGVGIADFNNDGLQDLFFGGNMVESKIYLNKGDFKFQDITETSGISTKGNWAFGISISDVNHDGFQDIYISMGTSNVKSGSPNRLFINQGNLTFKETAAEYGLDYSGQSIQAAFFDYDRDGDLDMYQLIGGGFEKSPIVPHPIDGEGKSKNTDKLYRNDFDAKLGHAVYKDVSKEAGILLEGFGLGVSIVDINEDGWLDVYACNDYLSNDHLYINNKNGTFSEKSQKYFKHTSHFAMGNDVGDINNDGLVDIISVDMLPEDHQDRMLMFGPNQYDKFYYSINQGYNYQYMRNTLQLNRGRGKFSEIGQLAGVYKTSWSWSVLFADLDNDEWQDIHITNGFGKNITDLDFVKFRSDFVANREGKNRMSVLLDSLSSRPPIKLHNYAFRNRGDYTFEDVSEQWGFEQPTISNGAAYVDLDNDGDLDLVVNNIDEKASIFKNTTRERSQPQVSNYLKVKLSGSDFNKSGIGSKITIRYAGRMQNRLVAPVRGFESSVEAIGNFGLGKQLKIDTLEVIWPDGRKSSLRDVKANQTIVVDYKTSLNGPEKINQKAQPIFSAISSTHLGIDYKHEENLFNDFNYEKLLPHQFSKSGPCLAVGDVNKDGLEDFFVGAAFQQSGNIFLQRPDGKFTKKELAQKPGAEHTAALLFDADNDSDLDLYIATGSNEYTKDNKAYQDFLYLNDGEGNFSLDETALPEMISSGSCVVASDFDRDGDLDLFVGGRIVPGLYPQLPASYLLQNDHGKFTDVTDALAPGLKYIGMITGASWIDADNNSQMDLVVVGEWMPVTLFRNKHGKFSNSTIQAGLNDTGGWWQSITSADIDKDGDEDLVAGNWGLNNPYNASPEKPMTLCAKDFDHNGKIETILAYYDGDKSYPAPAWDFLLDQMPAFRKKISSYRAYANTTTEKLLSAVDTEGMEILYTKTLSSTYFENLGNGQFRSKVLPVETQFAPVSSLLTEDINHDGHLDLMSVGNFYATDVVTGRYDASLGNVLMGDGLGNFKPLTISQSGFVVDGDSKSIQKIKTKNRLLIVTTQNSDSLKFFSYYPNRQ